MPRENNTLNSSVLQHADGPSFRAEHSINSIKAYCGEVRLVAPLAVGDTIGLFTMPAGRQRLLTAEEDGSRLAFPVSFPANLVVDIGLRKYIATDGTEVAENATAIRAGLTIPGGGTTDSTRPWTASNLNMWLDFESRSPLEVYMTVTTGGGIAGNYFQFMMKFLNS